MFSIIKFQYSRYSKIWVILIISILSSCGSLSLLQESQTNTSQQVQIGSIGSDKDFLLQKGFNDAAIPNYSAPIKLTVLNKPFNKNTYKAFTKANTLLASNISVAYVDSIANKPKYLRLKIADKIEVIKAFNSKGNVDLRGYLSHNKYANVLTSISIVFNPKDFEAINKASAVFLIENKPKTYALKLYNQNAKPENIPFTNGVVFGYNTSYCCWQENNRHQLNIVDLVKTNNNCPNKTYRSANRAKKKINYYKL
tara:strand:+ start:2444 stop:3205 length:762 start_codon:yes stop_codon:yes gene_type:complete